jgi:hypothetical protein
MDERGTLTMSRKELNRLQILNRVLERRLTQAKAAEPLGLSLRHVERLCWKLKRRAAAATGCGSGSLLRAPILWHHVCRAAACGVVE